MYLQYVYVVMAEKLENIPVGIFKNSIDAQLAKKQYLIKRILNVRLLSIH